jgi:hypothetical protein
MPHPSLPGLESTDLIIEIWEIIFKETEKIIVSNPLSILERTKSKQYFDFTLTH